MTTNNVLSAHAELVQRYEMVTANNPYSCNGAQNINGQWVLLTQNAQYDVTEVLCETDGVPGGWSLVSLGHIETAGSFTATGQGGYQWIILVSTLGQLYAFRETTPGMNNYGAPQICNGVTVQLAGLGGSACACAPVIDVNDSNRLHVIAIDVNGDIWDLLECWPETSTGGWLYQQVGYNVGNNYLNCTIQSGPDNNNAVFFIVANGTVLHANRSAPIPGDMFEWTIGVTLPALGNTVWGRWIQARSAYEPIGTATNMLGANDSTEPNVMCWESTSITLSFDQYSLNTAAELFYTNIILPPSDSTSSHVVSPNASSYGSLNRGGYWTYFTTNVPNGGQGAPPNLLGYFFYPSGSRLHPFIISNQDASTITGIILPGASMNSTTVYPVAAQCFDQTHLVLLYLDVTELHAIEWNVIAGAYVDIDLGFNVTAVYAETVDAGGNWVLVCHDDTLGLKTLTRTVTGQWQEDNIDVAAAGGTPTLRQFNGYRATILVVDANDVVVPNAQVSLLVDVPVVQPIMVNGSVYRVTDTKEQTFTTDAAGNLQVELGDGSLAVPYLMATVLGSSSPQVAIDPAAAAQERMVAGVSVAGSPSPDQLQMQAYTDDDGAQQSLVPSSVTTDILKEVTSAIYNIFSYQPPPLTTLSHKQQRSVIREHMLQNRPGVEPATTRQPQASTPTSAEPHLLPFRAYRKSSALDMDYLRAHPDKMQSLQLTFGKSVGGMRCARLSPRQTARWREDQRSRQNKSCGTLSQRSGTRLIHTRRAARRFRLPRSRLGSRPLLGWPSWGDVGDWIDDCLDGRVDLGFVTISVIEGGIHLDITIGPYEWSGDITGAGILSFLLELSQVVWTLVKVGMQQLIQWVGEWLCLGPIQQCNYATYNAMLGIFESTAPILTQYVCDQLVTQITVLQTHMTSALTAALQAVDTPNLDCKNSNTLLPTVPDGVADSVNDQSSSQGKSCLQSYLLSSSSLFNRKGADGLTALERAQYVDVPTAEWATLLSNLDTVTDTFAGDPNVMDFAAVADSGLQSLTAAGTHRRVKVLGSDGFTTMLLSRLLEAASMTISAVCKALTSAMKYITSLIQQAISGIYAILNTAEYIPLLSDLCVLFSPGQQDADTTTLLQLAAFVTAVPAFFLYKLMNDGTSPSVPFATQTDGDVFVTYVSDPTLLLGNWGVTLSSSSIPPLGTRYKPPNASQLWQQVLGPLYQTWAMFTQALVLSGKWRRWRKGAPFFSAHSSSAAWYCPARGCLASRTTHQYRGARTIGQA